MARTLLAVGQVGPCRCIIVPCAPILCQGLTGNPSTPFCEPPHLCSSHVDYSPEHSPSLMKTRYSDFNVYIPSGPSRAPMAVESEVPMVNSTEQPGLADGAGISAEDRGTIRILIIDDDRTLREGCASVLQIEGYSV